MDVFVLCSLGIFGLMFGSFAGAQVWRLRAHQLVADKAAGESVDKAELRRLQPLTRERLSSDRSRCLSCGHVLHLRDLVPLFSWLSTRGRCRYCQAPIGRFEPVIELGTATFFVVSYLAWPTALETPLALAGFALWLVAGVGLAILLAYDAKWFLLPDVVVFPLVAVSALYALVAALQADASWLESLLGALGAVGIMSGLYLLIYLVSRGRWIGFGDVKLGIVLGLLLGQWPLALLALFLANLFGTLVVLPGMVRGQISRSSHVPFGPFLILGTIVAVLWGQTIIGWYMAILLP